MANENRGQADPAPTSGRVLSVADQDRIDALGGELRGAINSLAKEMRRGFETSNRSIVAVDKKLQKALYEGNGKPAIFRWLEDLQRWQNASDVKADERQQNRNSSKRDTRRFMLDLLKEALRSGLGLLLALWLGHSGGLF